MRSRGSALRRMAHAAPLNTPAPVLEGGMVTGTSKGAGSLGEAARKSQNGYGRMVTGAYVE